MKALVVVAHPDDIPLWIGGTICRLNNWNSEQDQRITRQRAFGNPVESKLPQDWEWHGFAMCCSRRGVELKTTFVETCSENGVIPKCFDFEDHGGEAEESTVQNMASDLDAELSGQVFDYVFTHSRSPHGEYGPHPNHIEVREAVQRLVGQGKLTIEKTKLAYFSYGHTYRGCGTCARLKAEDATTPVYMPLTYDALKQKVEWVHAFLRLGTIGNPQLSVIRADLENIGWPCPTPEAFEGNSLRLPMPFVQ